MPATISTEEQATDLESLFELPNDLPAQVCACVVAAGLVSGADRANGQECLLKIWSKTKTPADGELRKSHAAQEH